MDTTNQTALALMKVDLGYFDAPIPAGLENYLVSTLASAEKRLLRAGVVLVPGNVDDDLFLSMYAAWMYRKRIDGSPMPEMLQDEIRNRQVDEALADAELEDVP